jgi:hypothetical protein
MPQEHEIPAPVTTKIRLLLYTDLESSIKIRLERTSAVAAERSTVMVIATRTRWEQETFPETLEIVLQCSNFSVLSSTSLASHHVDIKARAPSLHKLLKAL